MIRRLTNPNDFCDCIDDVYDLFQKDDEECAHFYLRHDKESIKNSFGNTIILNWEVFVWANQNKNFKYDALVIFINEKSIKFNCKIFSEFLWLSKNPKVGVSLFKKALDFAKQNKFSVVNVNTVTKNPSHKKLQKFYTKLGFEKDSESYLLNI